jgi:hypothetical protein
VSGDICQIMIDIYRERGPMHRAVPVSTFLASMSQPELEQELGGLLDNGTLAPMGKGSVALAPALRLSLVTRQLLGQWLDGAALVEGDLKGLLVAAIRAELRSLAQWARDTGVSGELAQQAAQVAGVVAMHGIDPVAMDVVAGYGGPASLRLAEVLSIPAGAHPWRVDDLRRDLIGPRREGPGTDGRARTLCAASLHRDAVEQHRLATAAREERRRPCRVPVGEGQLEQGAVEPVRPPVLVGRT